MKKRNLLTSIIVYYMVVFVIISIGFIRGNSYDIYDNGRACAVNANDYWQEKYGWDNLEIMFDGCVHKKEGWYGFSWREVFNMYQRSDNTGEVKVDDDFFKDYTEHIHDDVEYDWSDREYVEYISDRSARFAHDYVYIRLNGEILFVEYGPTNTIENYEYAIPYTVLICGTLLMLPLVTIIIICIKNKTFCRGMSANDEK